LFAVCGGRENKDFSFSKNIFSVVKAFNVTKKVIKDGSKQLQTFNQT
jgi:hypothetical protein